MRRSLFCVLAALSLAAPALADPPPGTVMKVTPPQVSADIAKRCLMRYEIEVAQVGHLKVALTLTPGQVPVFETWRNVHLEVVHNLPCPAPAMGLDVPAPQRMLNQISALNASLDALRKEQPATEALYRALSPAQQAVFDGPKQGVPPPKAPPPPPAKP
jgi:hypothetical protein